MSGTFPSSPILRNVKITSFTPTLVSVTQSLQRQVRTRGGQRWLIEGDFPPMTRGQYAPIFAFLLDQDGQYETFTYIPPNDIANARGTVSGTITCVDDGAIGDTSIPVDSTSGTLLAGDFIKFSNHTKIYMVTSDVNLADSVPVINFKPKLLAAIDGTTSGSEDTIIYDSIPFNVALAQDTIEAALSLGNNFGMSLQFVEVF